MADEFRNEVNLDWNDSVVGIPPTSMHKEQIVSEIVAQVKEAVSKENSTDLVQLIDLLLSRDSRNNKNFTVSDIQLIIEQYGGSIRFKEDLLNIIPPIHAPKIFELRRRANNGQYLTEDYELANKSRQIIQSQQAFSQNFIVPAAKVISGVYVQEFLEWINSELTNKSNSLADDGCPLTAAAVATFNDILPHSLPEIVVGFLPFKFGPIFKSLFKSIAKKPSPLANKVSQIENLLNKKIQLPEFNSIYQRIAKGDLTAELELNTIQETILEIAPSKVLRKNANASELQFISEYDAHIKRAIDTKLTVPKNSTAQNYIIQNPDGTYAQKIISGTLKRSPERRSRAHKTGRKQGVIVVDGQDLTHLVPDILMGDDALYNLIRADKRINRSYLKEIDNLINQLSESDLAKTKIEITNSFDSTHDLLNRHAKKVVFEITIPKATKPRTIILEDPLWHPPLTDKQLLKLVIKAVNEAKLDSTSLEEQKRRLIEAATIKTPPLQ